MMEEGKVVSSNPVASQWGKDHIYFDEAISYLDSFKR